MNILLIGSGGREHALAWKIAQGNQLGQLYIAPGNAGTAEYGENVDLDVKDFAAVKAFVLDNGVNMVVVGPEGPLVQGIWDYFQKDGTLNKIPVTGPGSVGARLEGSKAFAKEFMEHHKIPTAAHAEFTIESLKEGLDYIGRQNMPIVLKADGLAAGKGVVIAENVKEAQQELKEMLLGKFGQASEKVVVEAFLDGIEVSVFAITDGQHYKLLRPVKDYKRIGEGDTGLNTGGMGVVSPLPFTDDEFMGKVEERVVRPTIDGLKSEDIPYKGILYFGLMKVNGDPYVIEYNCRFGDPEAEVLLPLIKSDFIEVLKAVHDGTIDQVDIEQDESACATVILVSGGYPEQYEKGKVITGLEKVEDSLVFHAGTKMEDGKLLTNGGRVLAVTSFGPDLATALKRSFQNAEKINFEGKYYRKDIGFDIL